MRSPFVRLLLVAVPLFTACRTELLEESTDGAVRRDLAWPVDVDLRRPDYAGPRDFTVPDDTDWLPWDATAPRDLTQWIDVDLPPPPVDLLGKRDLASRPDLTGDTFCTGDTAKAIRGAQLVSPLVSTGSQMFLNCCDGIDIIFHTEKAMGNFMSLSLIAPVGSGGGLAFPLGDVAIGDDPKQKINAAMTWGLGGTLYGSGISAAGPRIYGWVNVNHDKWNLPYTAKVCLTVKAPGDVNDGMRIWAPNARVMGSDSSRRFAIYLLKNQNVNAVTAAKQALSSLVLADQPLLDLYSIRYYRQGDHHIAFETGAAPKITGVGVFGLPFVVTVDAKPIYMGGFWTQISSVAPSFPTITIEDIQALGVAISPPPTGGMDPRGDARILQVLTETAKLAP